MIRAWLVAVVVLAAAAGGCLTALKRGFHETVGATGAVVWTVPQPPASNFHACRSLAVGEVANSVGSVCPPAAVSAVRPALTKAFASLAQEYPGGEPSLTVDVTVQWYKTSEVLGTLVSPESWLIWLVKFRRSDGQILPDLVVVANSEAARTSEADLVEAAAKALAECLRKLKQDRR